jgi:oxygen-dependent protoporphyrinogen oxidase
MGELIDALTAAVSTELRTGCRVDGVEALGDRGYRLNIAEGAPLDAAAVVLACPAWHAVRAVEALDPDLAATIAEIPSSPVAVVHFGYDRAASGVAPHGFGFLAPRGEGLRVLGCLWASSIFEGRADVGGSLLTTMIGGATDPEAVSLEDDQLIEIVRGDLERAMGIAAKPGFVRIFRHPRGIPQYTLGHSRRVAAMERRLERWPGVLVCGNSYRGISVNACAAEAPGIAAQAIRMLDGRPALTTK